MDTSAQHDQSHSPLAQSGRCCHYSADKNKCKRSHHQVICDLNVHSEFVHSQTHDHKRTYRPIPPDKDNMASYFHPLLHREHYRRDQHCKIDPLRQQVQRYRSTLPHSCAHDNAIQLCHRTTLLQLSQLPHMQRKCHRSHHDICCYASAMLLWRDNNSTY